MALLKTCLQAKDKFSLFQKYHDWVHQRTFFLSCTLYRYLKPYNVLYSSLSHTLLYGQHFGNEENMYVMFIDALY